MNNDQEMLTMFNDDPDFLKKIVTGDESWMYGYGIKSEDQPSQYKRAEETTLIKARQFCSIAITW